MLASTHDLELINLVGMDFEPYHFNENMENTGAIFDYKIKKGKLYIFNVIKTMEKFGFPALLLNDAKDTFQMLEKRFIENNGR